MKKILIATLLTLCTEGVMAQKADIYPKPQQVEWGTGKAFDNTAAYTLIGAYKQEYDYRTDVFRIIQRATMLQV